MIIIKLNYMFNILISLKKLLFLTSSSSFKTKKTKNNGTGFIICVKGIADNTNENSSHFCSTVSPTVNTLKTQKEYIMLYSLHITS